WLGGLSPTLMLAGIAAGGAARLPTRVDNPPNSAIESPSLGVPGIGTIGASPAEVVISPRDGAPLPIARPAARPAAAAARWSRGPGAERAGVPAHLAPDAAVDRLLAVAGLDARSAEQEP